MAHPIHDPRTEALFNDRGAPVRYTMSTRLTRLEPVHPGEILHEDFMKPLGISINRLARDIVVPPGRIGAIVNGKRAITADTALHLGKYFGVSPQTWMGLQAEHDLRIAQRTIGAEVEKSRLLTRRLNLNV